jgi:hypothetical protein
MITTEKLFLKYMIRAVLVNLIAMVVLLVISIMVNSKFVANTPLVAGVVTAVFSWALHAAIKEAHALDFPPKKWTRG